MTRLGTHPVSQNIGDVLSGRFDDLIRFLKLFQPSLATSALPQVSPPAQPAASAAAPSSPRHFLEAVMAEQPHPPPRSHAQLPPLLPGESPLSTQLQPHTYRLSRRGAHSLQRAAVATCGHEHKAFAKVVTPPNDPPLRHPSNLRHVFREARVPGSQLVFASYDPRTLLVCAPESSLPLLQTAYDRAREFTRARGCLLLPRATVTPVNDPIEVAQTNVERETLLEMIRSEIHRLDSPANPWRARRYYSEALRKVESALYGTLKESVSNFDLTPLPPLSPIHPRDEHPSRPSGEFSFDLPDQGIEPPARKQLRSNG